MWIPSGNDPQNRQEILYSWDLNAAGAFLASTWQDCIARLLRGQPPSLGRSKASGSRGDAAWPDPPCYRADLHCLGYRKNRKGKPEWRKNAARRTDFFQLEYPIKPSAFARFILRDAKAVHCGLQGDRSGSQRLTFP